MDASAGDTDTHTHRTPEVSTQTKTPPLLTIHPSEYQKLRIKQPARIMSTSSNKFRGQLPPSLGGVRHKVLRSSTTYLARIAIILQDAPDKMLTFVQLMDKMGPLVREDKKSIENNVRVCLSSNKCFVKIPLVPDCLGSKRNFWKLDLSHITTKMVRRHFQDILDFFPELSGRSKDGTWSAAPPLPLPPPPPPSVQISCEVKFSGPFSIESLLKRDSPAPARISPLINVPVQSDYPRLYHSTPLDQKRCFSGDEEGLLSGHYHSSMSCPAGSAAHHKTSKQFCTGPPFPTYAVTPFNQSYNPFPTYDPHRFFF